MSRPIKVADYRELARRRLPKMVFDYLEGGAEDETGLAHNRAVFERFRFRPQRLKDVSRRSTVTSLFGKQQAAPFLIAPTGLNGILRPEGDLLLAQAAAATGIPFVLSTASNMSIEDIARRSDGERWFQLYVVHRELADSFVDRARAADYSTLVLTVDVGVNGYRERDIRNGFGVPVRYTPRVMVDGALHPAWSLDLVRHGVPQLANFATSTNQSTEIQAAIMSRQMDASFDWDALKHLRDRWDRKLLVKGLLNPPDAQRCIELGVDGVILSNHGGRQLDGAISPMEALVDSVAVAEGHPVLVDSGFRRGSDIVKALALGAGAVLIGRPTLYGLAARGREGVEEVIGMLVKEVDLTLAQIGCPSIDQLSKDYIVECERF